MNEYMNEYIEFAEWLYEQLNSREWATFQVLMDSAGMHVKNARLHDGNYAWLDSQVREFSRAAGHS
jgi:hypothetical protein